MNNKLLEKIQARPTFTILRSDTNRSRNIYNNSPKYIIKYDHSIPDSFDGRIVWDKLLSPVKNQGSCGSCWAFSSTSVLADKFNIQSLGQYNLNLSPARLILCDLEGREADLITNNIETIELEYITSKRYNQTSCYGGTLLDAFRYLYIIGTTTEECIPYSKGLSGFKEIGEFQKASDLPLCNNITGPSGDLCYNFVYNSETGIEEGEYSRFYRCFHYYIVNGTQEFGGSELDIRKNIYKWGPLSTAMVIYPDFYEYNGLDIYKWNGNGEKIGGHAIEIVGWGNENNIPFWIIKNSWGDKWGDKGYFRIQRGTNECKIEENCITCVPDFFYPLGYEVDVENNWNETEQAKEERNRITTNINIRAGGIDTETGYTRRAMVNKPSIEYIRPVKLEYLPQDWSIFIAGFDANIKNRKFYLNNILNKNRIYKYNIDYIFIFIIFVLIIIIIFIFINLYNYYKDFS
jgi:cathepsin B